MKRIIICLAVAALAVAVAEPTVQASPTAHAAKFCKKKHKKSKKRRHCIKPVPVPVPGTPGPPGVTTVVIAPTKVTSLPSLGFAATNPSVEMTPDGAHFGPYPNGGAAGGSVCFDGLDGQPLSAVQSLIYTARYTADNDTGGVGVPYLRVFLAGGHDAIFSPNTQPPNPDVAQGPFHTWAATSGVWRYDDDAGAGGLGTYGVNGAPYSTLQADHGTELIAAFGSICITTGFTSGVNLDGMLLDWKINAETFAFGS